MGIINILPSDLSNKIAAGEVVERPASVVKELVENSIDAGATVITVDISKGGVSHIRVTDNGKGMNEDDAKICFLRHATSKIKTENDLDAIYTLGFRGEALSSIGAVSRVSLYTRQKDGRGICVKCEGGEILSSEEAGLQKGTSIIVENLFFNTPARAKFLKKDSTEAGYISDIMARFIFAHPEISFRLIVNGKEKLFSPGDSSLTNAVCTVYGRDYSKNLIPVNYENDGVKVTGVIGNGNTARPNRTYESFFVNKRYIKSAKLMTALEEAFKNQIMIGKFPMAVLNVEINPLFIDINVHPTKLEVKFSDDKQVYQAVYYGVKNALYAIPEPEKEPEKATDFLGIPTDMLKRPAVSGFNPKENPFLKKDTAKKPVQQSFINTSEEKSNYISSSQGTALKNILSKSENPMVAEPKKEDAPQITAKQDTPSFEAEEKPKSILLQYKERAEKMAEKLTEQPIPDSDFKEPPQSNEEIFEYFKVAGQIFDTYIIVEKNDEIIFIDQHAAHERLKYEELLEELEDKGIYSQMLIEPVEVKLSGNELGEYFEAEEELKKLGFDCYEQDGTVFVTSTPADADMCDTEELLTELITQFSQGKQELISQTRQRLLYTVACKAAVKANHRLSEAEMESLVRKVFTLEKSNKNTCPHGRPISVIKTKKEIEKEFKRIV